MKDAKTITNRELNRIFSREIQACMVDGYDIDGKESEPSWGHPHIHLVKSQKGKKDSYRIVELNREEVGSPIDVFKKPRFRDLTVVEYKNDRDSGKLISKRRFYKIGEEYGDKCAWTEDFDYAMSIRHLQKERAATKFVPRGRELPLTGKTLETLVILVRKRGHLCKSVGPKQIASANIGLNYHNEGPIRVNVSVKKGDKIQDVQICGMKDLDYSRTSPRNISICKRDWETDDTDYVISKLIR